MEKFYQCISANNWDLDSAEIFQRFVVIQLSNARAYSLVGVLPILSSSMCGLKAEIFAVNLS